MADLCSHCEHFLTPETPQTELLCHHKFHTTCLLDQNNGFVCELCEENDMYQPPALIPAAGREQILKLYDDDERFRKQLKAYVEATKECAKPRKALADLAKQKKLQVSVRYAQIRAELEALYETKKDEIISSEDYKAYKKASAKQQASYSKLRTNYGEYIYSLSHLREKPSLKSLRSIWQTNCWRPSTFIHRALRFRYRRY
jgi:hypothetical protein